MGLPAYRLPLEISKMMFKIRFKNDAAFCICSQMDIPVNPHGGIRSVNISNISEFYAGSTIFEFSKDSSFSVQLHDVSSVSCRATLDEDDETWNELIGMGHPEKFNYHYYAEVATTLEAKLEAIKVLNL